MRLFSRRGPSRGERSAASSASEQPQASDASKWTRSLQANLDIIRDSLGTDEETRIRRLKLNGRWAAIVNFEGVVDGEKVTIQIVQPLVAWARANSGRQPSQNDWRKGAVTAASVTTVGDIQNATDSLASGHALLFLDGSSEVLAVAVEGYPKRKPESPAVEPVLRGPKESLVEDLSDNLAMLRRTLPDHRLRLKIRRVGTRTRTRTAIIYVQDIADPDLVQEVIHRVDNVQTDRILESRYLEELIQDQPWSPFPLTSDTERTDEIAAALLNGRVVIAVDRTPHALIVPATFFDFFRNSGDYFQPYFHATFVRWIRFLSFLFSFTLPALYIALLGFSPEVIPVKLALSIVGTRQGIPFPAVFEVLVLDLMMEVLREATVRMPRHMGQTIGVVGGIVLGTAVVQAGIVSNIMLIIVSLSAVASFAAGNYTFARSVRLLKYWLIAPTVLLGLPGYIGGLAMIMLHLASLESFGVPYTSPLAPLYPVDLKDTLVRVPQSLLTRRPTNLHSSDGDRAERSTNTETGKT